MSYFGPHGGLMKNFLMLLTIMLAAPKTEAGWWIFGSDDDENPHTTLHVNAQETVEQATEIKVALQALQQQMITKFNEIEANLADGKTETALTTAKFVLDTVRVKTGIDPKLKIQQSFLVPAVFPESARQMADLDRNLQETVIQTISDFRGGLYMDLMNLAKRTRLLYIRALKAEMSKKGGLTKEDREKIINDMVDAAIVPMPVDDKKGNRIMAFDQDVANEDHTYLFNRELKMYLMQDPDVKLEEAHLNSLVSKRQATLLPTKAPKPEKPNFFSCDRRAMQLYYSGDIAQGKRDCFQEFRSSAGNFENCNTMASAMYFNDHISWAKKWCMNEYGTK